MVESVDQGRRLAGRALFVAGIGIGLVGILLVTGLARGIPFDHFSRDAAAVTDSPWYAGLLSNLGIMIWWSGGAVGWFALAAHRRMRRTLGEKCSSLGPMIRFLFSMATLTTILAFDDLIMIHEVVGPKYFGIGEKTILAIYAVLLGGTLLRCWQAILETDYLLLGIGLVLFTVAVGSEGLPSIGRTADYVLEDGTKFLAILFWTYYLWRTSLLLLRRTVEHLTPKTFAT